MVVLLFIGANRGWVSRIGLHMCFGVAWHGSFEFEKYFGGLGAALLLFLGLVYTTHSALFAARTPTTYSFANETIA